MCIRDRDYDGDAWEEIPESLYNELVRFETGEKEMKLIDLLVKELPALGGWPKGVDRIEQVATGDLCEFNDGKHKCLFVGYFFTITSDWFTKVVTREEYEAALNISYVPKVGGEREEAVHEIASMLKSNNLTICEVLAKMIYDAGYRKQK